MKALVEEGKSDFSAILIYDTTRWGRFPDPRESIYWEVYFEKKGVEIIYTNDDIQNTKSFQSAIIKTVKHAAAGDYSRRLSVLITRACVSLAKEGFWTGGSAPYGYKRAEVDKNKRILRLLDPEERCHDPQHRTILVLGELEELETVERIFDYFVNKSIDLKTMARMLNHEGIPGPNHKWTQMSKHSHFRVLAWDKKSTWTRDNLYRLMNKEIYTGKMIYGIKKRGIFSRCENLWGDKQGRKDRHDKENVVVCNRAHPSIISEELWNTAQDIFHRRIKSILYRRVLRSSPYLLTGIIECGQCGFGFYGGYYGCKWYRNKNRYRYYRDEGYSLRAGKVCSGHYIKTELVDNLVLDTIKKRLAYYNSTKRILRLLMSALKQITKSKSCSGALDKKTERAGEEIRNLQSLPEDGLIYNRVDKRVRELTQEKLVLAKNNRTTELVKRLVKALPRAAQETRDYYDFCAKVLETSPLQEKRLILRNILKKIVIEMKNSQVRLCFYWVPKNIDFYLDLLSLGIETKVTKISLPKRKRLTKIRGRIS